MNFSGTYLDDDVQFLLKEIDISSTDIHNKEKLIQSGQSHYSEMITFEKPPSEKYKNIFKQSLSQYEKRFSQDVVNLAHKILIDYKDEKEITLVSLARAGTPIGVLLKRYLSFISDKKITHYCVSIIRDIGLDNNAIKFILNKHSDSSVVFIDGWTGKGVIGNQLKVSINQLNDELNTNISSNLYVVLDISGTAYYGASHYDYLIPSAIFNSTISGLVSRTIFNKNYLGKNDFHGYVFYEHLKNEDISVWFIEHLLSIMIKLKPTEKETVNNLFEKSQNTIEWFMKENEISNINFVKPGVGESTRVLLRRIPDKIYVKNVKEQSVQHLLHLAKEKDILIIEKNDLIYNSVAIIKELD